MDRYKIAIKANNLGKRKAFRFPPQNTVSSTINCIKHCIREKAIFLAENVPIALLDSAIIEVSKEYKAAILVETENIAKSFSISHSHRNIFSLGNPPPRGNVICYNCPDNNLSLLVMIYNRPL